MLAVLIEHVDAVIPRSEGDRLAVPLEGSIAALEQLRLALIVEAGNRDEVHQRRVRVLEHESVVIPEKDGVLCAVKDYGVMGFPAQGDLFPFGFHRQVVGRGVQSPDCTDQYILGGIHGNIRNVVHAVDKEKVDRALALLLHIAVMNRRRRLFHLIDAARRVGRLDLRRCRFRRLRLRVAAHRQEHQAARQQDRCEFVLLPFHRDSSFISSSIY